MPSEGYNLRTRFIGTSSQTTSKLDTTITEKKEPIADTSIKEIIIDKLAIIIKKTLNDYNILETYEKRSEIALQIKYTLRRYLTELVRYNAIELNEYTEKLPLQSVIAECNLFLLNYSINDS